MEARAGSVRLAELVATLSLATDLGRGQPMEQCIRRTALALRLADRLGLGEEDRVATYYAGLLVNSYCHADAAEQADWFGDDIAFKAGSYELLDHSSLHVLVFALRQVGAGKPPLERARRIAAFPAVGMRTINTFLDTHSSLASQFAARIGLEQAVCDTLGQAYEQWDGKGRPRALRGEQIAIAGRVVQMADIAETFGRRGVERARQVAQRQRGAVLDPALVDLFCADAEALLSDLDGVTWDSIIAAEPRLGRLVAGDELDGVLEALADLVDLKSPFLAGHSRGVANLAVAAARASGLPPESIRTLRRAALVHDLGRLGVSNALWDRPGPLSASERERVRLHAYLTDRMLANVAALAPVRELAARHHERLDGSGYPRGLGAAQLGPADRLLAAADVAHALSEPRPHRPALAPDDAARELRAEVTAGRLDGDAVQAVLAAAGQRAPARREWPAGLTTREVEVLGLLARGHTNKEIAQRLTVAPKTVSNHVEHVYAKIRVRSRAAATLYATQHGLVGSYEARGQDSQA